MTEKEPAVFPSGYRGDEYDASSSSRASFSSAVMLLLCYRITVRLVTGLILELPISALLLIISDGA